MASKSKKPASQLDKVSRDIRKDNRPTLFGKGKASGKYKIGKTKKNKHAKRKHARKRKT
ncbi:MAG: hypothetical protein V1744_05700 [Candidatus Altiarchaeota archaeon]